MSNIGFDYGMGTQNIDVKTGFRYGVIGVCNKGVNLDAFDIVDSEPHCPYCGCEGLVENECPTCGEHGGEYHCPDCGKYPDNDDLAYESHLAVEDEEYTVTQIGYADFFVIKSPYYTKSAYCSPCAPGAGDLDTPLDDGVPTYCLGHDFFDEGVAPYPVYSVATGELVPPEERE